MACLRIDCLPTGAHMEMNDVASVTRVEYNQGIMSDEALRILRQMTPTQKLRASELLYYSARRLKAAAFRAQHPEWTESDVNRAVREAFLYGRT